MEEFKPFPNKPWFLRICSISLWKTLWEKEKLLVTINFYFSHSIFKHFRELSAIFIKFKLLSANSFSFEEWKICSLEKGFNGTTFIGVCIIRQWMWLTLGCRYPRDVVVPGMCMTLGCGCPLDVVVPRM